MEYRVRIEVKLSNQNYDAFEDTFKADSEKHALAIALNKWQNRMALVEKVLNHSVNLVQ